MVSLQQIVDRGGYDIKLRPGEYEGPLDIKRPCVLVGTGSTVWRAHGPVVTVSSDGVVIDGLRIEVTDNPDSEPALVCRARDLTLRNVEVYGKVSGLGEEDGGDGIPRTIDLGVFAAGSKNVFRRKISLPAPARVSAHIDGVRVEPARLPAGESVLTLATDELWHDTCVWGEIFLQSKITRRIYLRGCAMDRARIIDEAQGQPGPAKGRPKAARKGSELRHSASSTHVVLIKGERRIIQEGDVEVHLTGLAENGRELDCYVFLLNDKSRVRTDDDFIFYNQRNAAEGCVQILEGYQGPGTLIKLADVPRNVQRIAVAFSVYEEHFGRTIWNGAEVSVSAGSDVFLYPVNAKHTTRTVTALHLYRYHDQWRLWLTDHRSSADIAELCRKYGVDV